jgi:hypothetical protein
LPALKVKFAEAKMAVQPERLHKKRELADAMCSAKEFKDW